MEREVGGRWRGGERTGTVEVEKHYKSFII